ncbi:MAG: hypothetical protein Q4C01_05450 [Clostridia bacterium]|nr:hypothetical protein [Clostridia bacterium]
MSEDRLYDLVAEETQRARQCEDVHYDYKGAERHLLKCIDYLKQLSDISAAKYQPYLYAYYDELCLLAYNKMRDRSLARRYETEALKYAKLCAARNRAAHTADVNLFEERLRNVL